MVVETERRGKRNGWNPPPTTGIRAGPPDRVGKAEGARVGDLGDVCGVVLGEWERER